MKLVISADHAGFPLKEDVRAYLTKAGHEVVDLGAFTGNDPDDYPDFAELVGNAIIEGVAPRGILICGSGVGASVAANKMPGIRAGLCHDVYSAHQGVEHDDLNVLCLGSEVVGASVARELVTAFLAAEFDGGDRYVERLVKVEAMEKEMKGGEITASQAG